MKWLLELGAANLACAGLPCHWPDEEADTAADAADVPEDIAEPPASSVEGKAEPVLH